MKDIYAKLREEHVTLIRNVSNYYGEKDKFVWMQVNVQVVRYSGNKKKEKCLVGKV